MTGAEALVKHAATADNRPFAASIARLPLRFRPGAARDIRMQVHVATTGPEPGNWLVAVAENTCRVLQGSVATPDARLFTDSDIGHSIITGQLSVGAALASRLLDYDGDDEELRRFGACFEFGGSP